MNCHRHTLHICQFSYLSLALCHTPQAKNLKKMNRYEITYITKKSRTKVTEKLSCMVHHNVLKWAQYCG